MTKQEFIDKIVKPLNNEFLINIYLNCKEVQEKGLKISSNSNGTAYTSRNDRPCVITWHRNFNDTLQVLFHEIGHLGLHGDKIIRSKYYKEIEAEMVAKNTCEILGIPYRSGYKNSPEINYINDFTQKYNSMCKARGYANIPPRKDMIDVVSYRIARVIHDKL